MSTQRRFIIIGVIAGLVIAFGVVLASLLKTTPGDACKQFIVAINKNEATKAYSLFTTSAQTAEPSSGWSAKASNFSVLFPKDNLQQKSSEPVTGIGGTTTDITRVVYGNSAASVTCLIQGNKVDSFLLGKP